MSTSNTPLTDGQIIAIVGVINGKTFEEQRVPASFARTLETRLHAAEELLKEAAPFVSGFRMATSRAGVASLSDAMLMKDIENRIAAHLASATTTKETTK